MCASIGFRSSRAHIGSCLETIPKSVSGGDMTNPTAYATTVAKPPVIEGVKTKTLRVIPDERGWLLEILRADDRELFTQFGQVYVSATYPGVVKAWHYHHQQV